MNTPSKDQETAEAVDQAKVDSGNARSQPEAQQVPSAAAEASSSAAPSDSTPYSTLSDPLPLPPYTFDATLSEDENFLTWSSILARHSTSRKGNMGTIFVVPPTSGDPRVPGLCSPPAAERILMYANNVPTLYAPAQKAVPEVHAEALAISRAARRGVALEGCTVYVTFPPCIECAKLVVAVGVKRCIFKRSLLPTYAEGFLAAAYVAGIEVRGTSDDAFLRPAEGQTEEAHLEAILTARELDQRHEAERDGRVRQYWNDAGETGAMTKARVDAWWARWTEEHAAAAKATNHLWGGGDEAKGKKGKQLLKARKKMSEKEEGAQKVPAKRPAEDEREEGSSKAQRTEEEP